MTTESRVVVVGSVVKVRPTDQPTGSNVAQLLAARNEFESFQIVIQAGQSTLQNVTVALSTPLTGPGGTAIPADNVTIYREEYYNVVVESDQEGKPPGRWPDVLIPARDPWFHQLRKAFPIDVPAGENRVAWIDVLVPGNAMTGVYSGSITVTGANINVTVPIQLTVFNATLPSTSSLKSAFAIGWNDLCLAQYGKSCFDLNPPNESEGWRLNALCARIALDNRITISYPQYQPLSTGNTPLFRQHTLPLLHGTAPTRLPGARLTSLQVDQGQQNLAAWRNEAQNQGFADRAFVYACDEPGANQVSWNNCRQAANNAEGAWPGVPILVTASIQNANRFNATEYIDRLVVLVNQMHDKPNQPNAGDQRNNYDVFLNNPNNQVWLYTSCMSHGCEPNRPVEQQCQSSPPGPATNDPYFDGWPSYVIDAPASEARAMGWLSFLYRTSGELHFQVTHCLRTAWTAQYAFGGNGDGTLFYPGDPQGDPQRGIPGIGGTEWIPLESMRLKLIRDGYQDYEYLKILKDRGQEAAAANIARGLFPNMYTTKRDDVDVQAARRQLAHLIDPSNVPDAEPARLDHLVLYRPGHPGNQAFYILRNQGGQFSPVFASQTGIGGYDLLALEDRAFAFDYNSSGKLDHLVLYRPGHPGNQAFYILRNQGGQFSPVFASQTGIGGYDLLALEDRAFAFDYNSSGKLDHLVLYRPGHPGNQAFYILRNQGGQFSPVFASQEGIDGYDLLAPEDQAFAFDY
jgi:hypothetical protein